MSIVRTLGIGLALSFVGCGASATQTAHIGTPPASRSTETPSHRGG